MFHTNTKCYVCSQRKKLQLTISESQSSFICIFNKSNYLFNCKKYTVFCIMLKFSIIPYPVPSSCVSAESHLYTATEWLKSSVQIQMSNLFVFVWREPFLTCTVRSIGETQTEEMFICLGCSSALLCSCRGHRLPFASLLRAVMDRPRPLTVALVHGSGAFSCVQEALRYTQRC